MKRSVAVIVDGTTAVPQQLAVEYDIFVIPFHVIVDGTDYLESDIEMDWLLSRLKQRDSLPTTAAPSIGEMLQAYKWAAERADSAVSIHLSSAFSTSYEVGLEARALVLKEYPQMRIEVIDSRTAEAGQLLIALEVAALAHRNGSFDEVVHKAHEVRDAMSLFYYFETLYYRNKGGRIFKAKPWADGEDQGGVGFRALVEVDHSTGGTMQPISRAKSKRQLFNRIVQFASERIDGGRLSGAIAHVNAAQDAETLVQMLTAALPCDGIQISRCSAASAVQSGEGFVTVAFHPVDGLASIL